jgi:hypothetical protein
MRKFGMKTNCHVGGARRTDVMVLRWIARNLVSRIGHVTAEPFESNVSTRSCIVFTWLAETAQVCTDCSCFRFRSNKHCPSARCANAVGKFLDIFTVRAVFLHPMQQLVHN